MQADYRGLLRTWSLPAGVETPVPVAKSYWELVALAVPAPPLAEALAVPVGILEMEVPKAVQGLGAAVAAARKAQNSHFPEMIIIS